MNFDIRCPVNAYINTEISCMIRFEGYNNETDYENYYFDVEFSNQPDTQNISISEYKCNLLIILLCLSI